MSLKHQFHLLNPVSFDLETINDEIAVDVPSPEEPAEMNGDQNQVWITKEAFFTVSSGAELSS